jgi:hypothetical protein
MSDWGSSEFPLPAWLRTEMTFWTVPSPGLKLCSTLVRWLSRPRRYAVGSRPSLDSHRITAQTAANGEGSGAASLTTVRIETSTIAPPLACSCRGVEPGFGNPRRSGLAVVLMASGTLQPPNPLSGFGDERWAGVSLSDASNASLSGWCVACHCDVVHPVSGLLCSQMARQSRSSFCLSWCSS